MKKMIVHNIPKGIIYNKPIKTRLLISGFSSSCFACLRIARNIEAHIRKIRKDPKNIFFERALAGYLIISLIDWYKFLISF